MFRQGNRQGQVFSEFSRAGICNHKVDLSCSIHPQKYSLSAWSIPTVRPTCGCGHGRFMSLLESDHPTPILDNNIGNTRFIAHWLHVHVS